MKKVYSVVLLIVLLVSILCSCSSFDRDISHDISEYVLTLPYKENFTVLQLSDIHMASKDDQQTHLDFLNLTIQDANADLIVITGDLFTFADKETALRFFSFIDSYQIPWTICFGNHEEQCYFSIDWLTDTLNHYGSNCIFKDIQDDDIPGNSNFAIHLVNDDGSIAQSLILMDSNRYQFGSYIGYDYIKDEQIEWYREMVEYTKEKNNNNPVSSLLFYHIPIPEFNDAWEASQNGNATLEVGTLNEKVCCPDYNSGLYQVIQELGSTKGIFVGHDHLNNFRILYEGIYFSYAIHSTNRIYYDENSLGGKTISIHSNGTYSFGEIYHHYEEVQP